MRRLTLDPQVLDDLQWWLKTDKGTAMKVLQLLEETMRDPFAGKGRSRK